MRHTLTLLIALLLAPLASQAADTSIPPAPLTPLGKKWKLAFSDEFDGKAIDGTKWKPINNADWVHPDFKTRQTKENCALDGQGHLVIRISRDADGTIAYNHGLQTQDFQKAFGYVEARVQFSTQPGWWGHVCLIRNNTLPSYGHDLFESAQEFDIVEDFYKPKVHPEWPAERQNVISQAFHATVGLGFQDQGDGSAVSEYGKRKKDTLGITRPGRVFRAERFKPAEYAGWHTVGLHWGPLEQVFYLDGKATLRLSYKDTPITIVPQKLMTGGVFKTPNPVKKDAPPDAKSMPFYGWLEDALLPDQLVVDYLRWYDEDLGSDHAPVVTVDVVHDEIFATDKFPAGKPLTFRIRAQDADGRIVSVQLFAKGYLRAEAKLDTPQADQTFALSNLFEGDNTVIATAVDNDGHVGLSAPLRVKMTTPVVPKTKEAKLPANQK
jgi:hypothetical protein